MTHKDDERERIIEEWAGKLETAHRNGVCSPELFRVMVQRIVLAAEKLSDVCAQCGAMEANTHYLSCPKWYHAGPVRSTNVRPRRYDT